MSLTKVDEPTFSEEKTMFCQTREFEHKLEDLIERILELIQNFQNKNWHAIAKLLDNHISQK